MAALGLHIALDTVQLHIRTTQVNNIKEIQVGENTTPVKLWSAQPSGDILMHSYFGQ